VTKQKLLELKLERVNARIIELVLYVTSALLKDILTAHAVILHAGGYSKSNVEVQNLRNKLQLWWLTWIYQPVTHWLCNFRKNY
jgi:hypothetical protein